MAGIRRRGNDGVTVWDGNPNLFPVGELVTTTDIFAVIWDVITAIDSPFTSHDVAKYLEIAPRRIARYLTLMARYGVVRYLGNGKWEAITDGEEDEMEDDLQ